MDEETQALQLWILGLPCSLPMSSVSTCQPGGIIAAMRSIRARALESSPGQECSRRCEPAINTTRKGRCSVRWMALLLSSFDMQAQRTGTGTVPGTGPRARGSLGKQFAGEPHEQETGRQAGPKGQWQEDRAIGLRPQS